MMAILGYGDYLCEACKYFDTDGADGNYPNCSKQLYNIERHRAIRLGEDCPYGYEFGTPSGYPVSMKSNEQRANEIREKLGGDAE